jgi:DNA-binding NtrC family response regulator
MPMQKMVTPRLLITDDDRSLRQALADALSRCGLEIATAGDGDEAIRLFETDEVHLVIADFHMPRVNGLDVIRHIRSRDLILPCILISAELTDSVRDEAQRMRNCGVFDKPLRLPILRQTVMQSLQETYGWKAS